MIDPLRAELAAAQGRAGGFQSQVTSGEISIADENCFVTSLVLLELADFADALPAGLISRALDFLEACEETHRPGAFRFYPRRLNSSQIPIRTLHADADDTALALLSLIRYGRRQRAAAEAALDYVIEPCRTLMLRGDEPPWVRAGAIRTWLIFEASGNPVDCCVNANIASLYALTGRTAAPGFDSACATIESAVRTTGASPVHMRSVAPYYAHPIELLYAVERAVKLGACRFTGTLAALQSKPWAHDHFDRRRPICCNSHGRPIWIAPALQAARQFAFELHQSREAQPLTPHPTEVLHHAGTYSCQ